MFRRVDRAKPVRQHGDRSPAGGERPAVGRRVDASGHAGDHRETRSSQQPRVVRPSLPRKACSVASPPAAIASSSLGSTVPCTYSRPGGSGMFSSAAGYSAVTAGHDAHAQPPA